MLESGSKELLSFTVGKCYELVRKDTDDSSIIVYIYIKGLHRGKGDKFLEGYYHIQAIILNHNLEIWSIRNDLDDKFVSDIWKIVRTMDKLEFDRLLTREAL